MKHIVLILFCTLIIGCRTIRNEVVKSEVFEEIKYDRINTISRDYNSTVILKYDFETVIKPAKQLSETYGKNKSVLETDYAISEAGIDELGNLYHNIRNKDSIPVTVKNGYSEITNNNVYKEYTDTISVSEKETIKLAESESVIENKKFLDWLFYPFGIISFFLIFIIILVKLLWRKSLI